LIIINIEDIGSVIKFLPAGLPDARDHAFVGEFPEADAAKAEIPHEASASAAAKTAVLYPRGKFLFSGRSDLD
jgi:hypothetical protein